MDRLLDEARAGPFYLRQPLIACMVVEAIRYNGAALEQFDLHAFVVMPNHVHLLVTPFIPLPQLTKSVKGITAKRANVLLERTGFPFWQDETFDYTLREREFENVKAYIEYNPVRAGLAHTPENYRWSSAWSGLIV